ncbi:phosphoethanolamine transferase [Desulforegula conservatrix]|uniref:phosphoethanolamine transferase n=1 Tax=Desulforegula conservatrix TaxID=153026 RepID=UPI000422A0AE|nr:phosphoethanolamine transferase [Desulforegula conservatrix]
MKNVFSKILIHTITALVVAFCLMLPGLLFKYFAATNTIWFNVKYFWIFFAFGLVLSGCRSFGFIASVLAVLGVLEITQYGSLAYFGDFINPFWVQQMFIEAIDVGQEVFASAGRFYFVPIIVLIPYLCAGFVLYFTRSLRFRIPFMALVVVLILVFPGIRMKLHSDSKDIFSFFPILSDPSLVNSLNTYYAWVNFVLIPPAEASKGPAFQAYRIEKKKTPAEKINIVVVMGESASSNHMSLYGYERKTTPNLDAIASADDNFIFKSGISAANATRSSLPLFYNVQYHPLDMNMVKNQPANLFKLAKSQGFKTFYISAQNINCLNGVNASYIDYVAAFDNNEDLFKQKKDDGILELAKGLELSDRNFIILHQRNAHAPYSSNYSHRPEFNVFLIENQPREVYQVNSYDNSMLYSDWLYSEIIKYFKSLSDKWTSYVFITSDHGEMFGENGLWGHNHLDMENYKVPFIYYGTGKDEEFKGKMKSLGVVTHYDLGNYLAELFGLEIINPGQEKGLYYLNGVAAYGRSGYMSFKINAAGAIDDVKVHKQ